MSFDALGACGGRGGGEPFGQQSASFFCLPFYFISPMAAATYMQPFLDKSNLEKYLTSTSTVSIPLIYPGIPAQAAVTAAAAAAATFPCLSTVLARTAKASSSQLSYLLRSHLLLSTLLTHSSAAWSQISCPKSRLWCLKRKIPERSVP